MNEALKRKIDEAKGVAWRHLCTAKRPVVMVSFGKDSIVLLWIIRQLAKSVPVFFFREPFQPAKFAHCESVIEHWSLDVHTVAPSAVDLVAKGDFLEILNVIEVAPGAAFYLPTGVNDSAPPQADWECGCEVLNKPTTSRIEWDWDVAFIGHRGDDIDPVQGAIPLPGETAALGPVKLVYPLLNWTRDDIWAASEHYGLPQNFERYDPLNGFREMESRKANPDYMDICVECLKPDADRPTAACPKTGTEVERIGNRIKPEERASHWRNSFVNISPRPSVNL